MSLSRRNLSFRDDISGPMSEACPLIGATEEEAQGELDALSAPEVGRERLSGRFGCYDFSRLPLD
jgi:hypothetical protein